MPPYIAVCASADNSLTIIDVTNPAAPVFVGNIAGAGAPNFLNNPWFVAIIGNYAYVCAAGDDSLTIIDVTNPAAPVFVGNIAGAGAPNFLGAVIGLSYFFFTPPPIPPSSPSVMTLPATEVR